MCSFLFFLSTNIFTSYFVAFVTAFFHKTQLSLIRHRFVFLLLFVFLCLYTGQSRVNEMSVDKGNPGKSINPLWKSLVEPLQKSLLCFRDQKKYKC